MNKNILKATAIAGVLGLTVLFTGCSSDAPSSTQKEHQMQERTQKESIAQSGMPAVKNFREKKMLKEIYEARDQDGLTTYVYIASMSGKIVYVGEAVGFPVSAGVQFNNPDQLQRGGGQSESYTAYPQAEPNGLYQPSTDEATWVMMIDKKTGKTRPVYFETRIICSPFKLN